MCTGKIHAKSTEKCMFFSLRILSDVFFSVIKILSTDHSLIDTIVILGNVFKDLDDICFNRTWDVHGKNI